MIERILENWLNKANERSFQVPLCHALAAEGHRVVHLSRHTGIEMGKDILTVGPDGVPCAYQLKGTHGGKLSMNDYRKDVQPQLHDLVFGRIVHPSIRSAQPHRAFLVINGELQEEVIREIDDFNRMRVDEGNSSRQIITIVRGDLFKQFQKLETDFWPSTIENIHVLLELFMDAGKGVFPKEKFASLLGATLPFETQDGKPPSQTEASRAFAAGAVLCSLSLSAFTTNENHAAEFEAWTLYFAYMLAVAEKWGMNESVWKSEADIAVRSMVNALARLCDELMQRSDLLEGNSLCDPWVYRVRVTYLLGVMGLYALWRRSASSNDAATLPPNTEHHDAFLRDFCSKHQDKLFLWGEYAVPQFLAHYLFYREREAGIATEHFLLNLVRNIAAMSTSPSKQYLAGPYSNAEETLPILIGLEDDRENGIFPHASYTLDALFQLFVRSNLKQNAKRTWPAVTRAVQAAYTPKELWEYYLWRCEGGLNKQGLPYPTQKWSEVRALSAESAGNNLPTLIKQYPIQYLGFLCVFPHRWNSSGIRWLATQI